VYTICNPVSHNFSPLSHIHNFVRHITHFISQRLALLSANLYDIYGDDDEEEE
jgi:uncharacterized circularly permuted ATP-grasp superfamily protein